MKTQTQNWYPNTDWKQSMFICLLLTVPSCHTLLPLLCSCSIWKLGWRGRVNKTVTHRSLPSLVPLPLWRLLPHSISLRKWCSLARAWTFLTSWELDRLLRNNILHIGTQACRWTIGSPERSRLAYIQYNLTNTQKECRRKVKSCSRFPLGLHIQTPNFKLHPNQLKLSGRAETLSFLHMGSLFPNREIILNSVSLGKSTHWCIIK